MSEAAKYDPVNHPRHYTSIDGVECIQVVETKSFNVGNAIKYLWRAGEKDDLLQDLRKAAWYVDREIQRLGGAESPEVTEMVPEKREPIRWAKIRIGRWEYEAEISPGGIATYENRAGQKVQAAPERYKAIRWY